MSNHLQNRKTGTLALERGEYVPKLGRRVTVHYCDCSALSRHTVLGEKTLKCDVCGTIKLGVPLDGDQEREIE